MNIPFNFTFIEGSTGDMGVEFKIWNQPVFLRTALHIMENFFLRSKQPAPVRVLLKRKGIQMRLHIAHGSGITVGVPRAAQPFVTLQDDEIVFSGLLQLDGNAYPRKAGTDDDIVVTLIHGCVTKLIG